MTEPVPTATEVYSAISDMEDALTLLESFGEMLTALSCGNVAVERGCLHFMASSYEAAFVKLHGKWEAAFNMSVEASKAGRQA